MTQQIQDSLVDHSSTLHPSIQSYLSSCHPRHPDVSMHQVIIPIVAPLCITLQWRHNGRDSVSNHQPHDCLLNDLFRLRWKKTWKLRVTGLYAVNSPHKWPVTRKMFPCNDVIMVCGLLYPPGRIVLNVHIKYQMCVIDILKVNQLLLLLPHRVYMLEGNMHWYYIYLYITKITKYKWMKIVLTLHLYRWLWIYVLKLFLQTSKTQKVSINLMQ